MSRYWSDLAKSLTPYVPGEQPRLEKLVKLNTNENPYPPSPKVMEAISRATADSLRRYPDPESTLLRQAIATRNGVQPEQVFVGNGSDEVIALAFLALLKQQLPLYFPDVSYSFYPVWSELFGIEYRTVAVAEDFSIDPHSYPVENGGIIIPNPNAPTGVLLSLAAVRTLVQRSAESVVVIDEAYIDFGGESAVQLVDEFDNVLVIQTLSKSRSLAGLRVGFAIGNVKLIEALGRVKNSFNSYPLDAVSQQAAVAAMQDEAYFRSCCQRVMGSRQAVTAGMESMGFQVLPSGANFIFATHAKFPARQLFAALRERGIVVRYFDRRRIDNFLRITIGTEQDNAALLAVLAELVS
jgi:histidinol-phosphate aminotransferase